jgi:hypothetical protein
MDTNSKNCFTVGQPIPDVNVRINSMDNQQRFSPTLSQQVLYIHLGLSVSVVECYVVDHELFFG